MCSGAQSVYLFACRRQRVAAIARETALLAAVAAGAPLTEAGDEWLVESEAQVRGGRREEIFFVPNV